MSLRHDRMMALTSKCARYFKWVTSCIHLENLFWSILHWSLSPLVSQRNAKNATNRPPPRNMFGKRMWLTPRGSSSGSSDTFSESKYFALKDIQSAYLKANLLLKATCFM